MANIKVFVLDKTGRSLLPISPARARLLLKKGKAKVFQMIPFTIQLTDKEIEHPVGEFTIGIDDGAKMVGIAVVNEHSKEVIFTGDIKLRQDVVRKMKERAMYRRTRRNRNLRYRKARFDNRKQVTPFPSIRQRKELIVRVVKDLKKIINITNVVIEQGQFDMSSMVSGRELAGKEFQQAEFEGRNTRMKVLFRDNYECQHCKSKNDLHTHHILPRSKGGSNTLKNLITLCKKCHDDLHNGMWILNKKPKQFKYPQHLMQGKWYIFNLLKELGLKVKVCFGWMTSYWRKNIGLEKSHFNDAIAMVSRNYLPEINSKNYLIIPRRNKVWENNPTKKSEEKNGFRHWDIVKSYHRTRGIVIGSVRSLKEKVMTLRTNFDDNFPVSYNKSKILWRVNKIIYIQN